MNDPNKPRSIARSVEIALVQQLIENGTFQARECAIIEKTESKEAPDRTPYVIVDCQNVTRTDNTSLEMYSKTANVVATLVVDSGQSTLGLYEELSRGLACWLEDLATMQEQFNAPEDDTDTRPIRGLYLHYIDEFQTDSDTSGTRWEFGVGLSLIMDEVES